VTCPVPWTVVRARRQQVVNAQHGYMSNWAAEIRQITVSSVPGAR
jgi:hypothetical protein